MLAQEAQIITDATREQVSNAVDDSSVSIEYMESHLLMTLLECALESLLKEMQEKNTQVLHFSPIHYLASWLFRNNPKHSERAMEKLLSYQKWRAKNVAGVLTLSHGSSTLCNP